MPHNASARFVGRAEVFQMNLVHETSLMNRALLTRLFDLVVVLFGVSVIVFLMIRLIPGDAVAIMLGRQHRDHARSGWPN